MKGRGLAFLHSLFGPLPGPQKYATSWSKTSLKFTDFRVPYIIPLRISRTLVPKSIIGTGTRVLRDEWTFHQSFKRVPVSCRAQLNTGTIPAMYGT